MKKKQLDIIISTITVFLIIVIVPLVLRGDFFTPFMDSFSDLAVTDFNYAEMLNDDIIADTNIVFINTIDLQPEQVLMVFSMINQFNYKTVAFAELPDFSAKPELREFFATLVKEAHSPVLPAELMGYDASSGCYASLDRPDFVGATYGFSNLLYGKDQEYFTVREFRPNVQIGNEQVVPFAVAVARAFDPALTDNLMNRANESETICYHVHIGGNMVSYNLDNLETAKASDFENKIILFGKYNPDPVDGENIHVLQDLYYTPLNDKSGGRSFPDSYSVSVHANILSTVLKGYYFTVLPMWAEVAVALLICYLNMLFYAFIVSRNEKLYEISSLLMFLIESVALLVLTTLLYHEKLFVFNSTLSIFALALSSPVYEGYEKSAKPLIKKTLEIFRQ